VPTIPHQGTLNRLHAVLNRPERPKNHKRSTAGARGAEVKHLYRIIELQQGWGGVGRECTSVTDTLGRRWIGKVKRLRVVHAEGVHCKCFQGNHGIFHSRRPPLTGGGGDPRVVVGHKCHFGLCAPTFGHGIGSSGVVHADCSHKSLWIKISAF